MISTKMNLVYTEDYSDLYKSKTVEQFKKIQNLMWKFLIELMPDINQVYIKLYK